jgi:predicted DNA-binding ribbon-helix-helix protein
MSPARNKRSLTIAKHRTSVSLEEPFWQALSEIAAAKGTSIAALVRELDKERTARGNTEQSLSAAIRVYVLEQAKARDG